ncbi:MAG: tRNA (guanine-N(1)-)-methyltransferase [candidate division TM6 bacterium GW2011_GWF2_28_16]|nr:MAG: tRNA (guanine-N(1)-)-methyltransferase [candidate division TM6 bacterium GW2011_GWF2_28_16]
MKITIITVFPEFYDSFLKTSIIARAIENKIVSVNFIKFSDMCNIKERIDVPTCGPGAGMVIKPEVVQLAIEKAEKDFGQGYKIFFSPKGEKLTQDLLKDLTRCLDTNFVTQNSLPAFAQGFGGQAGTNASFAKPVPHLILLCARYEGFDARTEQVYANKIISIGDYVVMGGDLPAQVFIESFLRLIPGIVGNQESVQKDSYSGSFLDYPAYSLPKVWNNLTVPEILFSGDHAKIEKWRQEQAAQDTIYKNFDWFISSNPDKKDIDLAKKFIPNHYVVLMHSQVNVTCNNDINNNICVGHTSITSLDIHDIARSSATYGIKNYFLVSALIDQQKILKTFLDFWMSQEGQDYNLSRFEAVSRIIAKLNFDEVIAKIREQEGVEPIIITTSAKESNLGNTGPKVIDYNSQSEIFSQKRPVLFVFGTGQGLSDEILNKSNYLLLPIKGLTDYNHLSVRSAAAIILDRWLGLKNKVE